jgi:uncharacterized pyridoxamine 5'-phosphate oxidase family protein
VAETVAYSLSRELLPLLQNERFVLLATIDKDTGSPYISAISWVFAPDEKTIRFACDSRARIVQNVLHKPDVAVTLFACGSVYTIIGEASVREERMENVPLKLSLLEIAIKEVRDVMFYGSRISVEPQYEKTYNKHAAQRLDQQVMEALRK